MRCCHFVYDDIVAITTEANRGERKKKNVFGYIIETEHGTYVSSNLGHRWTPVEQVDETQIVQMMRNADPPPIPYYGSIRSASDLLKETWLLGALSIGQLCVLLESVELDDPLYGEILHKRVSPNIARRLLQLRRTTIWPSNVKSWLYDRAAENPADLVHKL